MSSKYKFVDEEAIYFVTAVIDWAEARPAERRSDGFLHEPFTVKSCPTGFRFCRQNQGLQVHAWVLMPNPCLNGPAGFSHDLLVYEWRSGHGAEQHQKLYSYEIG
jgi:hypothetical protein